MDPLRTGLLRIADDFSLAVQNAARSFAFYSDGRDFVQLRETESGVSGEFPDHTDEGWPALQFQLPNGTQFQRASSSLLTRNAFFTSSHSVADLERWFSELGLVVTQRSGSRWTATLGEGAEVRAIEPKSHFGVTSPPSAILITQRRTPDSLVQAIQGMAKRQPGSS